MSEGGGIQCGALCFGFGKCVRQCDNRRARRWPYGTPPGTASLADARDVAAAVAATGATCRAPSRTSRWAASRARSAFRRWFLNQCELKPSYPCRRRWARSSPEEFNALAGGLTQRKRCSEKDAGPYCIARSRARSPGRPGSPRRGRAASCSAPRGRPWRSRRDRDARRRATDQWLTVVRGRSSACSASSKCTVADVPARRSRLRRVRRRRVVLAHVLRPARMSLPRHPRGATGRNHCARRRGCWSRLPASRPRPSLSRSLPTVLVAPHVFGSRERLFA